MENISYSNAITGQVLEQDGLTFSPRGLGIQNQQHGQACLELRDKSAVAEAFVRPGRYPRE